ncbi:MAG: hypothetical protein AAGA30_08710 [Planctomycetota bacterium]
MDLRTAIPIIALLVVPGTLTAQAADSFDSIEINLSDQTVPGDLKPTSQFVPQLESPPLTANTIMCPGPINVTWASANSRYQRLYFEEKLLERHGIVGKPFFAPLHSSAVFFSRAITFPLYSWKIRPGEFQSPYSLGRPGSRF